MSIKNYRFVSPGVFINEIDNSQIPASPAGIGPVVIGRAAKGPALRPTQVSSFSEFVRVFGNPSAGASGDDVWREGASLQAPTYGVYAAQAYLRNSSPLTYIRLLGAETTDGTPSGEGKAGWQATDAFGLFIFESDATSSALAATAVNCIDTTGYVNSNADASFTILIPAAAGGLGGTAVTILLDENQNGGQTGAANTINVGTFDGSESDALAAGYIIDALNGVTVTRIVYATSGNGQAGDDLGITATQGSSDTQITLTMDTAGNAGNITALASATGHDIIDVTAFTEGQDGGTEVTGALGAIFYANSSPILRLSGNILVGEPMVGLSAGPNLNSANIIVENLNSNSTEFKMTIQDAMVSAPTALTTSFNFDINSSKYIRKVFNTNPQLMTSDITLAANRANYFLGETFDRHINTYIDTSRSSWAGLARLYRNTGANVSGSDFNASLQSAITPWIIGCDLGDGRRPNLMKFHALDEPGDWTNRTLKISIQDIKQSTSDSTDYGTFTVLVRRLNDSDNVVQVVEQFNNCNLNPNSLNYVCRKVGDKYRSWSDTDRIYRESGDWANNSSFIRVEVNSDIENAALNAAYLPFGFQGIVKYADDAALGPNDDSGNWITSSAAAARLSSADYSTGVFQISGGVSGFDLTASLLFPAPEFRVSASAGNLSNVTDAYFGLQTARSAGGNLFDASTIDLLRPRGGIVASMASPGTAAEQRSMEFSLDDVSGSSGVWISGSAAGSGADVAGTSLTAVDGFVNGVLDAGFDRFTVPLYGGFDGLDVLQMNPFANYIMAGVSNITDATSYQFNSIRRSIDSIADPEVVQMNLAAIPGCTHEGLTTNLINVCEDRADALAVIDIPYGYSPRAESQTSSRNNTPSTIASIVNGMRNRGLNSSYGCTFYPWVRARDTINGAMVWLPPSIAALGTFSSSQRKTQVWFAPAGFNRGGLTEGSAGLPVVDVSHQLRRKDRDELYSSNVNPIAKFPAEGIVIFGQKTLQVTPSALDRINVRRLLIFLKKRISQMAATILFDQNVKTTWARFTSMVDPFLADVKTNFGLTDYLVVLDDTTTTPDLIDRNILYAKIFLKPARAIEYIAIDFNITRTGAAFID